MNLLIDESLQHDLARLLGQAGHNAVHVTDLGLRGAPDETLLAKPPTTIARIRQLPIAR